MTRLLLFLLLAGPACFAETWSLPFFTSDPHSVLAAAARYRAAEDTPALILDYAISAQIDEAGKLQKTTRIITKVMRVQGIDPVQRVSLAWSVTRENRPAVKARVITGDGQPHLLDESGIVEQDPSTPGAVGSVKLLFVSLPEVNVDSIVELQIVESDRDAAFPGGRLTELTVPPELPIAHFKASIATLSPSDLHVETRSFPGAKIGSEPAPKGHAALVEAFNFEHHRIADFVPPEVASVPTILFTNIPSWQSIAHWYSQVVDKANPPPPAAHQPFAGDELSIIEKTYEDLRKHVQDNGLELAAGPVAPRPAADILKSGSADSKDEALLLIAKLAEAGIPAKMALISAAPQPDVLATQPGFEAFNRALVYVGGKTPLWIDPTAEYTSVARLPAADQGRWALVVDPGTDHLVRTSVSAAADNRQSGENEIRLADGKPAKVHQTLEASGSFEEALRPAISQIAAADEDQKRRIAASLLHGAPGMQVDTVTVSDPHHLLEKCRLQIDAEGYPSSVVSDEGGYIDLPGPARLNFQRLSPLLQNNGENAGNSSLPPRTADFYVGPPFITENSYHLIPPAGYRLKEVAPIAPLNIGPLSIATTTKFDKDGSLWFIYTLTQPKDRLTPREVDAMRSEAMKIRAKNAFRVELENVGLGKMKAGDLSEGLKILRQDADAAKDNVNPALRLASAYVLVGARAAAIKLCEDLLKRESKSEASSNAAPGESVAAIYERLGWAYQHDEFGRFLAPGMNAAEAEKNLRKATDLAPDDAKSWLRLADLYTYNSAGIRYGRSARLNDAIEIFSRLDLNVTARNGKLNDYALLLLHAHRYPELRELFIYPQADLADQSIKWAGMAASRSEADLTNELEFRYPSANERQILLFEAGRRLIAAREYQAAMRVFRLAGEVRQGGSASVPPARNRQAQVRTLPGARPGTSPVTQSQLETLDRTRVFDESALSKQPAIAVFQHYVQSLLDPENPDDWKKWVTGRSQNSTLQAQRTALLQFFRSRLADADNPDTWPYICDLINTRLVFTAEGSDAGGLRLKVSSGLDTAAPGVIAYVVKQGNQYLVAGLLNSDAPSVQAVANAHAGNVLAARQWLDWQHEAGGVPKLPDAEVQPTLDFASAQLLLSDGKPGEAATILQRLHQQNPSAKPATILLADSLIQNNRAAEAKPYIESLEQSDPGAVPVLRLRERLLAQERNYVESVAVARQICAKPNASAIDWNDLAWTTLFTRQNAADAKIAAEKAAQLTGFNSPAILHTLAIAQASAHQFKDSLSIAYKFAALSGDLNEMRTIFGTISEEIGLPDIAFDHFAAVSKESDTPLSNYSFAQLCMAAHEKRSFANPTSKAALISVKK